MSYHPPFQTILKQTEDGSDSSLNLTKAIDAIHEVLPSPSVMWLWAAPIYTQVSPSTCRQIVTECEKSVRKMKCIEELVSLEMLIDFTAVKVIILLGILPRFPPSVVYPVGGTNGLFLPLLLSVGSFGGQRALPGARGFREAADRRLHLRHKGVIYQRIHSPFQWPSDHFDQEVCDTLTSDVVPTTLDTV